MSNSIRHHQPAAYNDYQSSGNVIVFIFVIPDSLLLLTNNNETILSTEATSDASSIATDALLDLAILNPGSS